jgi:hypothetical protein
MILDIGFHWVIDMLGAASFACILRACDNPFHDHGRIVTWISEHRWLTQSIVAVIIAYITVQMIG